MRKKYSSIKGKEKQDNEFECRTCTSQEIETEENFQYIELYGQSLEYLERFCNLHDTIGARKCAIGSVLTRIRKG